MWDGCSNRGEGDIKGMAHSWVGFDSEVSFTMIITSFPVFEYFSDYHFYFSLSYLAASACSTLSKLWSSSPATIRISASLFSIGIRDSSDKSARDSIIPMKLRLPGTGLGFGLKFLLKNVLL